MAKNETLNEPSGSAFGPDCQAWKDFAFRFEMLEGFEPDHRDKSARHLFQYYVAGTWDQYLKQRNRGGLDDGIA